MTVTKKRIEVSKGRSKDPLREKILSVLFSPKWHRWAIAFTLAVVVAIIITPGLPFIGYGYKLGDVALREIRAPKSFLAEDTIATEAKRVEAERAVLPVYDFDSNAAKGMMERLGKRWEEMDLPEKSLERAFGEGYRESVTQILGSIVQEVMQNRVVGELLVTDDEKEFAITVRYLPTLSDGAIEEEVVTDIRTIIDLKTARERVASKVDELFAGLSSSVRRSLKETVTPLVQPNLTLNRSEIEVRKLQARESVKPVLFQVQKGEVLIPKGTLIGEKEWVKLQALYSLQGERGFWISFLAAVLWVCLFVGACYTLAQRNIRKFRSGTRDLLFMAALLSGSLLLTELSLLISEALPTVFSSIPQAVYRYAIPVAAAAAIVRLCLNSETALVFSIPLSIFTSFLFGEPFFYYLYFQIGSLVIIQGVTHCSQRSRLFKAGFQLGVIQVLFLFSYRLIEGESLSRAALWQFPFAMLGGLFVGMVITVILPVLESLFKYTTDIRLVELSTMDHPLLKELILKAPGSYHHSLVVGSLAEAAARAIGANPLLCRVGCLFHDIGKTRMPQYFIENQMGGENIHDRLSPHMSALIIVSHVKEGIELAKQHGLPQAIVDIIPQHHGTSPIRYFFDKAKVQTDPDVHQVKEQEFRYPGPKPQTREAGIIMLADSVEASARTLTQPTKVRIQGMVQKTVNRIFTDGQLNECMLTLKDLHEIARSFIRVLGAIYHQRIDYPEPVAKGEVRRRLHAAHYSVPAKIEKTAAEESQKQREENLKRLGMS